METEIAQALSSDDNMVIFCINYRAEASISKVRERENVWPTQNLNAIIVFLSLHLKEECFNSEDEFSSYILPMYVRVHVNTSQDEKSKDLFVARIV